MPYRHLSLTERNSIEKLRNHAGFSLRKIGGLLNRSAASISRELRRNATGGTYRYKEAERAAKARRANRSRISEEILDVALELMCEGLSPEQAAEAMRQLGTPISHQTIYNRIWEDHAGGGLLWHVLRFCGKTRQRCRRYISGPSARQRRRGGHRSIHSRPRRVAQRRDYGHWEMDLLEGRGRRRPALVLVERKSRFILACFLPRKDAGEVLAAARRLLDDMNVKTITTDNGPEFACAEQLETALGCKVYYTDPYKSWQKGAVENANGLLRQYLPKGTSFLRLPQKRIEDACAAITWRIRKCLNWKSPDDLLPKILA